MLEKLIIKNYALIDELEIPFTDGFNVLTGETGAGKSIIIGAFSLILGDNINQESIRDFSKNVIIEGHFIIKKKEQINFLIDQGIEIDDDLIIVKRIYQTTSRKNKFFINNQLVIRKVVEKFFSNIVELIGQHSHQILLDTKNHVLYLDKFAKVEDDVKVFHEKLTNYKNIKRKIKELIAKENETKRRIDYLEYAVNEIENANLSLEDYKIYEERKLISNYEKIFKVINNIHDFFDGEKGINSSIFSLINNLEEIIEIDPRLNELLKMLNEIDAYIEEINNFTTSYLDTIDYSEERIRYLDQRIDKIEHLKSKYGESIEEILEFKNNASKELSILYNIDIELENYNEQLHRLRNELIELALKINERRRIASVQLKELVEDGLKNIGMEKTTFEVVIKQIEDDESDFEINGKKIRFFNNGMDFVEFMVSTNVGEPLKPLKKIASGGEISRIMLALKLGVSIIDPVEIFIFDEIDTGIGGNTANMVGREIYRLSNDKQILCITHLPQIASYADHHIKVEKRIKDNKTIVIAKVLNEEQKIVEIARMLSGEPDSQKALEYAKTLLEGRKNEKKKNKF